MPPTFDLPAYRYDLPEGAIASHAVEPRDHSRLLVLDRKTGSIIDKKFYEVGEFLRSGDVLVLNDTRVLRARIWGRSAHGGRVEILCIQKYAENTWDVMVRASQGATPGFRFEILMQGEPTGLHGEVTHRLEDRGGALARVEFECDPLVFGEIPLPPYILKRREQGVESHDEVRYQTVYSRKNGSIAAPTAGLHFTERLIDELKAKGIRIAHVTLHIGPGTFRPVQVQDIREHTMHAEFYELTEEAAEVLTRTRNEGHRVIAVGTSSVRVLESAWNPASKAFSHGSRQTEIWIYPGRGIASVDAMLTNFHLPESPPLVMASTFVDLPKLLEAYRHALEMGYRFYSFGDAMLLV